MAGIAFHGFTLEAATSSRTPSSQAVSPGDILRPSQPTPLSIPDVSNVSRSPLALSFSESQPFHDDISSSYIYSSLPTTPLPANDDFPVVDDELERRPKSALGLPAASSNYPPSMCQQQQRQIDTQLLLTQLPFTALTVVDDEMVHSATPSESQRTPSPTSSHPSELPEASTSSQTAAAEASTASSSSATTTLPPALPPPMMPDNWGMDVPLEVDEGFEDGDTEEFDLEAMLQTFRRAQDRPGTRKYGYQPPTVVYSRPRMRKKISLRKRNEEHA